MDTAWFKVENKDVYLLMDVELKVQFGTFKIYGQVSKLPDTGPNKDQWVWSTSSGVPENAETLPVAQAEVLKQASGWI